MTRALLDSDLMRQLEQLELVVRRLAAGRMRGERRSRRRGAGSEFADYRDYVQGDDLRRLDWNLYGRLDRLFLKLFHEEEDLQLAFWLDASRSMLFGDPSKFEYARKLVAALAYVGLCNFDRVTVEAGAGIFPPARGRAQVWRLLDFLGGLEAAGPTDLAEGLKAFRFRNSAPGMKVVVSDFLDKEGFEPGIRWLVGGHHEVVVIHLLAPQELKPPIVGDLALEDCEDGALTEVSITGPLLRKYQANLQGLCSGLRAFCRARGLGYFLVPTSTPLKDVLLQSLRRAGVLR